jgi:hypothetical protein
MHKIKGILCIGALLLLSDAFAQPDTSRMSKSRRDSLASCVKESDQVDIPDIYRRLFHKKAPADECDSTKRAKHIELAGVPAFGYSLSTKLAVVFAGNAAFHMGKDKITRLSVIDGSISYTQKNQIILPILSNLWTKRNKFNLLGELRYYSYPGYTYGLGGRTTEADADLLNYNYLLLHEAVLRHVGKYFYAGIAYNLNYHWNITEKGYADGETTDFQKYGFTKKSVSSGISVNALYDTRKNTINPSQAMYASIAFCPNLTFLGSDHNYQSLLIDVRKYIKLGKSDNVLALWSYNWFTFNGNAPYLDLPSTGWDAYANMGRGYIQGRFTGKNLVYLEAEYRFGITHNGLLGGVLFTNAQSVTEWPKNRFETILPAIGTGLRIKLNKDSRTNVSIDYAFGLNGSNGLFINLGEVF